MTLLMLNLPYSIGGTEIFVAYVLVFSLAAAICVAGAVRASRIEDTDTRRGLTALLLTSGSWALTHVLFLLVPSPQAKLVFYQLGLVVGFSTIGPWLYFCSAYTGRSLHRSPTLRRVAVAVFLGITAVKLTNPIHHLYFSAEFVMTPFPHYVIHHHIFHWVVMGLTYGLAMIGYFMLLELFWQTGHNTTPFVALVGITGLPVLLDIFSVLNPQLVIISYEPLGVAIFAVGVLFVYLEDFQAIQFAGEHDDPVIVLDEDDRIRDFNKKGHCLV